MADRTISNKILDRVEALALLLQSINPTVGWQGLNAASQSSVSCPRATVLMAGLTKTKILHDMSLSRPGAIVKGKVVSVEDFGALIDIGTGDEALLHISQISSDPIQNVKEVLSEGSSIFAKVLETTDDRLSLSTRVLEPEPGDMIKKPKVVFSKAKALGGKYMKRC